MNDRGWHLTGKMLSKEATHAELEELRALRLSNPEMEFYIEALSEWWRCGEGSVDRTSEQAFQKHLKRMQDMPLELRKIVEKDKGGK